MYRKNKSDDDAATDDDLTHLFYTPISVLLVIELSNNYAFNSSSSAHLLFGVMASKLNASSTGGRHCARPTLTDVRLTVNDINVDYLQLS